MDMIEGKADNHLPPNAALPHKNLPFSSSSRHVPTTLFVSFLQDLDLACLL